jgi:hypothetical protein
VSCKKKSLVQKKAYTYFKPFPATQDVAKETLEYRMRTLNGIKNVLYDPRKFSPKIIKGKCQKMNLLNSTNYIPQKPPTAFGRSNGSTSVQSNYTTANAYNKTLNTTYITMDYRSGANM